MPEKMSQSFHIVSEIPGKDSLLGFCLYMPALVRDEDLVSLKTQLCFRLKIYLKKETQ